ncbi:hypothetical protein CYMTET_30771 [Cymbomonas tetramitiformis]|uniref:Uncharacterized protein n=1 Tax=Cymbomonas tetramitiformis TaxID=36881 RepID=A0AAE0FII6_9CHLO|nr:hypothetical protein CYMTET_30771 [Cymbomonas tetramitiformis]
MASFFCVAHGASSYFSFLLEENKVFLLLMSPRKLLKDLKMCSHLNHEVTSDEYFNLLTIEGIRKFSRVRKLLQKEHSTSNSKNYDVTLFMVIFLVVTLMWLVIAHSLEVPLDIDSPEAAGRDASEGDAHTISSHALKPVHQKTSEMVEHDLLPKFDGWISNLLQLNDYQPCSDSGGELCVRLLLSSLCSLVYFLVRVVQIRYQTHQAQSKQLQELETARMKASLLVTEQAGEEKKWEVIEKRCQEFKAHFERGDAIPRIMGIKIADNKNIISTVLCTSLFLTVIKSREQSGFPILGILDDLLPFDILTSAVGKLLGLDFG